MGMEQVVTFAEGSVPTWPAVRDLLASQGLSVQMRMIDGQLALPDHEPPAEWRELRVAAAGHMVTLRRQGDQIACVTWGNAEGELRRVWNALTWACAEAGSGRVLTPAGPVTADEYRRNV